MISDSWHIDLANTAWGAIVAALVAATVGVLFKGMADSRLAKAQGEITKQVQQYLLGKQTEAQKSLQTQLQAQHAELQTGLTRVQASLTDQNNAASARREYEYEARKHLYAEVEPLLFQLHEAIEEAHHRVLSLTRTDRAGKLDGSDGWLSGKGYYLASTAYKLLLPAAYLRLMQRRMTFVDFGLDSSIDLRYLLLKLYVRILTDDFSFAALDPALPYQPNHRNWRDLVASNSAEFSRQGLLLGTLENVADQLIVEDKGKSRTKSFGEFESLIAQDPMEKNVAEALALFRGFSPNRKPVLARMLTAQGCLARLILCNYHQSKPEALVQALHDRVFADAELVTNLRWGQGTDAEIETTKAYLNQAVQRLARELPRSVSLTAVHVN